MPDIAAMRALGWGDPDAPDFRAKHIKTLSVRGIAVPVNANPDIQTIFRALFVLLDGTGAHLAKNRDDWGYANRPIRGATEKSYHAWGLAVDANALENVLGSTRTSFNVKKVDAICSRLGLRWGFNYAGRKDPMHFEFLGSPSDARRIANRLRVASVMKVIAAAAGVTAPFLVANGLIAPSPSPAPKPVPTVTKTAATPTVSPTATRPTPSPTPSTSPATATPTGKPSTPAVTPTSVPTVTRTATKTIQVPTRVTATKTVTKTVTVTKTRDYVLVRPGDTLYRIATAAGTTVAKVRALNPALDPLNLQPGTLVRVK